MLVGYLSVISDMTQISVCVLLLLDQVTAGPNVVLILADDLGVNDVSWNNPRVSETPSLGRLARAGDIVVSKTMRLVEKFKEG